MVAPSSAVTARKAEGGVHLGEEAVGRPPQQGLQLREAGAGGGGGGRWAGGSVSGFCEISERRRGSKLCWGGGKIQFFRMAVDYGRRGAVNCANPEWKEGGGSTRAIRGTQIDNSFSSFTAMKGCLVFDEERKEMRSQKL